MSSLTSEYRYFDDGSPDRDAEAAAPPHAAAMRCTATCAFPASASATTAPRARCALCRAST
ncbi:hypothetical protein ACFSHR_05505 [Azotobacter chroococcum]